ncbi:hypothetical protein HY570_03225, partial [Candidatus Micrarchaeota archaeon]|nr:hypothetical protein [Candidatus Micrarchaeota archaeon]
MKKYFIAILAFAFVLLISNNVSAACNDGTSEGLCSITKPYKCTNGNLTPNCAECGCPSPEFSCINNACQVPGVATGICGDNTQSGSCSTNNPGFVCDRGLLISGCFSGCCPAEDYGFGYSLGLCTLSNTCFKRCTDGTKINQCSTNFPSFKCVQGDLVPSCGECGCPPGTQCTFVGTAQTCKPLPVKPSLPDSCELESDESGKCASNGWYCNNATRRIDPTCNPFQIPSGQCTYGTLEPGCTQGCCPSGSVCDENNLCKPAGNCADGTRSGETSTSNPGWVCNNGRLSPACSTVGCPVGYYCNQFDNTCWPTGTRGACSGTPNNQCASGQYQGFRCVNSSLAPDCSNCGGCSAGFTCNNADGRCYATTTRCIDNTPANSCSTVNLGAFCNGNNPPSLVDSCSTTCQCPTGFTCGVDDKCRSNVCLGDGTPINSCSQLNPGFFCESNGNLVPSCNNNCPCPSGFTCSSDNTCKRNACLDGTALNSCSVPNEGYLCTSGGDLILNCNSCTCQGVNSCAGTIVGAAQQLGNSQFTPLFGSAIFLVILSVAVMFMLGYSAQNPQYIAKAKIELFQMAVTIGMASIVTIASLTMCTFISQFGYSSPIISSITYMQSLVLQADSQVRNLITASLQNQLRATEWEFTPTIWSAVLGVPGGKGEGKNAHLKAVSQSQEIAIDMLLPVMASLKVQLTALSMINQFAIELLLPFGVLLRIIPFTRQAGDFLIALSVALYIVFPMTYVLNSYIYDNFVRSASGIAFSGDGNIDFAGIGQLLPQAIFFPNLSIVITIS